MFVQPLYTLCLNTFVCYLHSYKTTYLTSMIHNDHSTGLLVTHNLDRAMWAVRCLVHLIVTAREFGDLFWRILHTPSHTSLYVNNISILLLTFSRIIAESWKTRILMKLMFVLSLYTRKSFYLMVIGILN